MARAKAEDLGHYVHARLYEKTFRNRRHDIAYFVQLANDLQPTHLLEYGAGAGRVTLPLLREGHRVTAIDKSREMLALLQERSARLPEAQRERLTMVRGDMRNTELTSRFPLVLATFNVVAHLPTFRDMAAFLRRARSHLTSDGWLIFDVSLPHPDEVEADPEHLYPAPRFKHPDTGEWIRQTERFEYDPATQTLLVESRLRTEHGKDELVVPLYLRQWFPKEVEAMLFYEGFVDVETRADYTDTPGIFTRDSMLFLARPGAERARRKRALPSLTRPSRRRGAA